jgi:dTDP-glucose 4,6-dehydratase
MIKNKRILITGGGGFIGVALAKQLIPYNNVALLDKDFVDNAFAYSCFKDDKRIETILVDILDKDKLKEVVQNYDIIIHAAGFLGVQKVIENVAQTLEVNYSGTRNILESIDKCEKILIFSTSEVYGSNAINVLEDNSSSIPSIENPRWSYNISKLAAEYITLDYYRKGLPVVIVRPFNIFGGGRVGDYAILRFIYRALKNEDLEVYGNGNQIRAWCYIDDFCDAIFKILENDLENDKVLGESFNIGNPLNTITMYRLAKLIIKMCNSKSKIVFKGIDFADVNIRMPDITKAKEILGYSPKIELEEGLEKTIKWAKDVYKL